MASSRELRALELAFEDSTLPFARAVALLHVLLLMTLLDTGMLAAVARLSVLLVPVLLVARLVLLLTVLGAVLELVWLEMLMTEL